MPGMRRIQGTFHTFGRLETIDDQPSHGGDKNGETGRQPGEKVIQFRGGLASPLFITATILQHGVGGIGKSRAPCRRHSTQSVPKQRRGDTVGEIFRERFQSGRTDLRFGQIRCGTTHQVISGGIPTRSMRISIEPNQTGGRRILSRKPQPTGMHRLQGR